MSNPMTTHAMGTVINGQLQLDQPLPLPNRCRVTVAVAPTADVPADWRERMLAGLQEWQKLIREHPVRSGGLHFTRDELHERD